MVRAVTPIPFVKARFFDRCGKPLAGGKVYTYEANTTTYKTTYKDPYGLTPNTNPIILDAAGEADIYLDGTYRIRITDRNDVLVNDVAKIGSWFSDNLQDTLDNISGAMDEALKPILQNLDDAINTAAAAGAGASGWTDTLIAVSENLNQRQINDGLESIAQLANIQNPRNGQRVYVKSYHANYGRGGGTFVYDSAKSTINDGGVIINGWVRQFDRTYVLVEWFGAKSYGDGDSTVAFQKAIDFAQSQPTNMEVHLSSYTYEVGTIHIKNSTRRMVSIVGTYNGYASALAYDFYKNTAGSVILHNGTGKSVLFDVDNTSYHNGQVQFRYIGIVGNYWQPDTQTEGTIAIRINKAAKDNPDGNGYRIGHIFEQVAFVNCFYPIVFTSELSPPTYNFLNNHVGDVILDRCSCYTCKSFFVVENTTLNRFMIQNSFIFAVAGQAIITKQLDGVDQRFPEYSPCSIRLKISDTHFEGVRGLFDLRQTGVFNGEAVRSHVEISNVTREASSIYPDGTGSALGFVNDVDFLITGHFEDAGWNEKNEIRLPADCTIQSAIKMNPGLEGINCNKSPYNINTRTDTRTLANGATKNLSLVVTDDFGVLDVDLNLKFSNTNNQQLGLNTYNVSGLQSNRKLIKSESTDPNITVVDNVVSSGNIIAFNITNNTGADLVITSQVTKNVYGMRYWIYVG